MTAGNQVTTQTLPRLIRSVTADRILGRVTAGTGVAEQLTAAQVRTLLSALTDTEIAALIAAITPGDIGAATSAQGSTADSAVQPGDLGALATLDEVTDAEINSTKLNGIESGADVTDAVNVASTIHGATAKTTPVDADTVGLIDSAASNVLKKLSWSNIKATLKTYFDTLYRPASDVVYYHVALSSNGAAIESGTGKGFIPITVAGTVTLVRIDLDPANEPTDQSTLVDCNTVNRSTGAATSILTTRGTIAIGENTDTATIDGSPSVSFGDWLQIDVDQGSDGQDLICTVGVTPD